MTIPTMTPVVSSQIESVGHDPETNTLHVRFKRGGHYSYADVTEEKYENFLAAPSLGKFLGSHIKGVHPFTKHS